MHVQRPLTCVSTLIYRSYQNAPPPQTAFSGEFNKIENYCPWGRKKSPDSQSPDFFGVENGWLQLKRSVHLFCLPGTHTGRVV